MAITPAGLVGIGTTGPSTTLHLDGSVADAQKLRISRGAGTTNYLELGIAAGSSTITANGVTGTNGALILQRDSNTGTPTESARIDSSGRLLVGTSISRGIASATNSSIQVETITNFGFSITQNSNDFSASLLSLGKSRGAAAGGTTIVQSGDDLGAILFAGADGTDLQSRAASIVCSVDGTPGANDMPGRLVFSTTSDGAASVTERLRITSAGVLQVADAGNITVGTTTGTKIGTATTQKIGFYNATPVVQPAAVADATDAATVITQLNDLLAKLRTLGIIAT
jgi:hypothetical protein